MRAYRFLLRPTVRQEQAPAGMPRDHCSLYNGALQERRDAYRHTSKTTVRHGDQIEAVSPRVGLMEGYDRFIRVIHDSPQPRSRLWSLQQEVQDNLEAALREETGAAPGDPLPDPVAGRICWIHSIVVVTVGREMTKGRAPAEVSREVLGLVDDIEEPLSDRVLGYATRG